MNLFGGAGRPGPYPIGKLKQKGRAGTGTAFLFGI